MKNWTIRRRIILSFGVVIGTMAVMVALTHTYLRSITGEVRSLESNSVIGLLAIADMRSAVEADIQHSQTYSFQNGKAAFDSSAPMIQSSRKEVVALLHKYELTSSSVEDKRLFAAIKDTVQAYSLAQDAMLQAGEANNPKEVRAIEAERLEPASEKVIAAIQDENDLNENGYAKAMLSIKRTVSAASLALAAVAVAAVLIAFASGFLLLRAVIRPLRRLGEAVEVMRGGDFTRRLDLGRHDEFGVLADGFNRMADDLTALIGRVQKTGIQVNTSVTEIASTAKEQQATASEIAATTTEIGATSREISATSKELVKTMGELSSGADQTAVLAGSGQTGLSRMEETMRQVMEAASSINAKLTVLNEKAGNINQMVTTITKVADQTNLLSLNASIEAEKAGEYGRGFAVVATEIRRLADQTAVATYDIEQMVKEVQSAVSAGVMGMDKFSAEVRRGMEEIQQVGGQLSQIIQQVQGLAPRFESVNEGMQAQSTGAEQISQALVQLSEAAQQTVDSLRQSNIAIEGLDQVVGDLHGGISRFKLRET